MVLGPMTTPPPVPDTLEVLLDPAWLTAALGTRFPGIRVTRVIPGPVVERLSTNARFTVECEGGLPAGLVPTLCAKGYFGERGRHIAHIGEPEARFYATLAETTGVHTLKSVYADVHPETRHGVVITEDVVAAGGEFLDALSPYTADQTAQSLAELARTPRRNLGRDRPGVRALARIPSLDVLRLPRHRRHPGQLRGTGRGRRRARGRGRATTCQGDARAGGAPGRARMVGDPRRRARRQPLPRRAGRPRSRRLATACNVGTGASTSATTSPPRSPRPTASGRSVTSSGTTSTASDLTASTGPRRTTRWDAYRAGIAYGFFMWAITLVVKPEIIQVLLQRLSAAAAAHDSFGSIGV